MEPIVNFCNQIVSWMDGENVFSNDGCPVVFIRKGAALTVKDCYHLGQFDDGVFRDRLGCIVASVAGKWWCRGYAVPHGMLQAPTRQLFPIPDCTSPPTTLCRLTAPLLSRSTLDWDRFVLEEEARQPWKTRR